MPAKVQDSASRTVASGGGEGRRRAPDRGARLPVMTDVALLSGVSQQTVSRVVNGLANVSAATRTRVLEAMEQLGYHPNSAARALATSRTKNIGVIGAETALFGPASNLLGIERAADAAGYSVSVTYLRDLSRAATEKAGVRFADQSVDGIILMEPVHSASRSSLSQRMPVVTLGRSAHRGLPSVTHDNVAGARMAVEHLLELGHKTVWHLAGPMSWTAAADRMYGWRVALEDHGLPVPEFCAGDWTPRSGFELGLGLASHDEMTAVFVANDQMALGVLRPLRCRGAGSQTM